MRKLKNKDRLTALAIIFSLVFVCGAAYAFANGTLDIHGRFSVAQSSDLSWNSSNTFFNAASGESIIVISPTAVASNQRIAWNVEFSEAGTAILTATAENNSLTDFEILSASYKWTGGANVEAFKFDVTIDDSIFKGVVGAGHESMPLYVEVEWDGTLPPDFEADTAAEFINGTVGYAGTLEIEFEYAPV